MTWIASRRLTSPDGKPIDVALSAPEEKGPDEWVCFVRVATDEGETLENAIGVDAFQAITSGLRCLELRMTERHATWLTPGWHGFPRVLALPGDMIDVPRFLERLDEDILREQEAALWRRHSRK
jgi:hypothetical protein